MRKARGLHRALGGKGDPLAEDAPGRSKGMHLRTYERKLAVWREAVGQQTKPSQCGWGASSGCCEQSVARALKVPQSRGGPAEAPVHSTGHSE